MPNKSKGKHWVQVTDEEVIKALQENGGFTAATARALGICRNTLLQRIQRNPELRKAQLDARENGVDVVEKNLFELAQIKDFQALPSIKLYLQNNSPKYSERLNVTMTSTNTNINLENLSMEELEKLYELIEKSTPNEDSDSSGDVQEESV